MALIFLSHFNGYNKNEIFAGYWDIARSNEILGWGGVGNRQLLCFFKA
jgi:hypothetical protein